jgi:hypothetical protein
MARGSGTRDSLQVASYDVFQHGTLAARLAADDDNLWQVNGVRNAHGGKDILKFVDKSVHGVSIPIVALRRCFLASFFLAAADMGCGRRGSHWMRVGSEIPPCAASELLIVAQVAFVGI